MFGIGPLELVMILVVALLVFGPKRVPELARTLGKGLAEFRRASNDLRQSLALDEIQQDLRRDLGQNQTIHRPPPNPETAKAGDTSEPAQAGTGVEGAAPPAAKHPGELPLGNDHEHHDEDDETTSDSPVESASESSASDDAPNESDLGSVPVSQTKTPESRRG